MYLAAVALLLLAAQAHALTVATAGGAPARAAPHAAGPEPLALNSQATEISSEGEISMVTALHEKVRRYEQAKAAFRKKVQRELKERAAAQANASAGLEEKGAAADRAKQKPAGWFGAFDQSESTFDEDAWGDAATYPERDIKDWNAEGVLDWYGDMGLLKHGGDYGLPDEWFSESASGGPQQAWQTYYPVVGSVGGDTAPWYRSSDGAWHQHYEASEIFSPSSASNRKDASWFDTYVDQFDDYGRQTEPDSASARYYIEWEERTRSVNLTCADPGCTANATLAVFDAATEKAQHCRITVKVHATDFDDDWSRENVEWLIVNGQIVNEKCDPMAKACNATRQLPLHPCLTDYDVTNLLESNSGSLELAGKITDMVDECPVDGNLLSGEASVTCYVAALVAPNSTTSSLTTPAPLTAFGQCPLQCAKPNCTAQCTIKLHQELIVNTTCKLSVQVNQTDYDGDEGSTEEIELITADGANVATEIKPGKNPCKSAAQGSPLNSTDLVYTAVDDVDVTNSSMDGTLVVEGKLSEMVDECASNGFLFDAIAFVNCTL